MAILMQCTKPDLIDMISATFPKIPEGISSDAWRAIPTAVESICAHCKPLRSNPSFAANDA